jgi:hypothetical protein
VRAAVCSAQIALDVANVEDEVLAFLQAASRSPSRNPAIVAAYDSPPGVRMPIVWTGTFAHEPRGRP